MTEFVPEGLRKQREFLDRQHAMRQPCWACGERSNQQEARNVHNDRFSCPSCGMPMAESSPLVAVGPCVWYWYWSRPEGVVVTSVRDTRR